MIDKKTSLLLAFLLVINLIRGYSQESIVIFGRITDAKLKPIELVNVFEPTTNSGTTSNRQGYYELKLHYKSEIELVFSCIGYRTVFQKILAKPGDKQEFNISLESISTELNEINVNDKANRKNNMMRIDPKVIRILPDISGNFESIVKTMPGVTSNNELSSQYSVRGGNFDENLIYVNDIEIYRPFLIRSGEQEGLSFVNPDMVSSILFSAGGFEAKYGDKMSSVLDIKYKKPYESGSSFSLSLLGGSAEIEGCSKDHRFTHITGVRYKTNQYLLNSMDVQGDYNPSFVDVQSYLTYDLSDITELSFLFYYAKNQYLFKPVTRETSFGTYKKAYKLKIYFDGHEIDDYITSMAAISATYKPNQSLRIMNTISGFHTSEQETYDILGQYYLNELETSLGGAGDSVSNIGIGTFLNHARNYLDASVISLTHNGTYKVNEKNTFFWGATSQLEMVNDRINEWELLDSAGYSIPYSETEVNLNNYLNANNTENSVRMNTYIQNSYKLKIDSNDIGVTGGIRATYWSFNKQFILSPRLNFSYFPNWEKDIVLRFATGYYYQLPFYKEVRDLNGNINRNIKAQKSIHFVAGGDMNFRAWDRPFKLVTEVYYKILENIIPYDVDNVSIRYYGLNNSKGYATGIDMKVNGEFVSGVDSWASLSLLRTREIIKGNYLYYSDSIVKVKGNTGYIPRPTNQFFNFSMFFQDYLPSYPSVKIQLNLVFGSRLPVWKPETYKKSKNYKVPGYRRVDIGFSKMIKDEDQEVSQNNYLHFFKSLWLGIEVFNLLDIKNTISYNWVTDIYGNQFAVPNYLTSRRLNIKLIAKI